MGNSQNIAGIQNNDVQIIKYDPNFHEIHLKTNSTNMYLIGTSITAKTPSEQAKIQSLIKTKTSFASPYVEPLHRVQKIRKQFVFQHETEFILLFKKPYQTLADQIRQRKLYNNGFSDEQTQIIVENCIQGLEYLRINGLQHGSIDSANITINQAREIRITDPWMILRGQQTKLVSVIAYPSPQKYRSMEQTFINYKIHQSDLFSLGMVILQILDLSTNENQQMKQQPFDQFFNPSTLNFRISKIQSSKLQNYCRILTSFDPKRRKDIYNQFNSSAVDKNTNVQELYKANTNVQELSKLRKSIIGVLQDRQKPETVRVDKLIHQHVQIEPKRVNYRVDQAEAIIKHQNNYPISYANMPSFSNNLRFQSSSANTNTNTNTNAKDSSLNKFQTGQNYLSRASLSYLKLKQAGSQQNKNIFEAQPFNPNHYIQNGFNKGNIYLHNAYTNQTRSRPFYESGFRSKINIEVEPHLQINDSRQKYNYNYNSKAMDSKAVTESNRTNENEFKSSYSWQQTPYFNPFSSFEKKQYFPMPSSFNQNQFIRRVAKSNQLQHQPLQQSLPQTKNNLSQNLEKTQLASQQMWEKQNKINQSKPSIQQKTSKVQARLFQINDDNFKYYQQKLQDSIPISSSVNHCSEEQNNYYQNESNNYHQKEQNSYHQNMNASDTRTECQKLAQRNFIMPQNVQASDNRTEYQKLVQRNFPYQNSFIKVETNKFIQQFDTEQKYESINNRSPSDILNIQKAKLDQPFMQLPTSEFGNWKQKITFIEPLRTSNQNILVSDQSENQEISRLSADKSSSSALVNRSQFQLQYERQSYDMAHLQKIDQEEYSAIQSNSDLNQQDIQGSQQNIIFTQLDNSARNPVCPPSSNFQSSKRKQQQNRSQSEDQEYVIQEYEVGSRYEGQKKHGMRNGWGKFYYQQGSLYDGEWKDNKMHGYGKLYYANGQLAYQGDWFKDEFYGQGKVYNDNPAILDGPFDYNDFNLLQEQWVFYQGGLVSDVKQGLGKIKLQNDQVFMGNFYNDKLNGQGRFYCLNGSVVHATWKDSLLVQRLQ